MTSSDPDRDASIPTNASSQQARLAAFHQALGELAQVSTQLEETVAVVMWGLVGIDQVTARRVLPNGVNRMLRVINDALPVRVADPALIQLVNEWRRQVDTVWKKRNDLIHSRWFWSGHADRFEKTSLKPLGSPLETITTEDVRGVAVAVEEVAMGQSEEVLSRLIGALPQAPWAAGFALPPPSGTEGEVFILISPHSLDEP